MNGLIDARVSFLNLRLSEIICVHLVGAARRKKEGGEGHCKTVFPGVSREAKLSTEFEFGSLVR